MSAIIATDHIVSIHYTLEDGDTGETLDSSEGRDPLEYLHGHGQLVPGLESALEGKAAGEKIDARIDPEDGYGPRDEARLLEVPKDRFEEEVEVDQVVHATAPNGHHMRLRVAEVGEESITLDANHPFAGKILAFSVEVVDVRAATKDELERGHASCGGGGCSGCDGH